MDRFAELLATLGHTLAALTEEGMSNAEILEQVESMLPTEG